MKPAPSLIDEIYRATFARETNPGWRSNHDMRQALMSARRFSADERMAAFMADLAIAPFAKLKRNPLSLRIADSLRVSARLPHEAIWIEYPLRAYQRRSAALLGGKPPIDFEMPEREGWLIQQHPKIDSACIMHLFSQDSIVHDDGFSLWTFPFAFGWVSDDNPLPWQRSVVDPGGDPKHRPASYLVGMAGYACDNVCLVRSSLIDDPDRRLMQPYTELLREWAGVLRRVWALLATIDHLPLLKGEVRTSKGFLSRGRIRKYLSHQTITLNIPAKKDTRVLARQMIAIAHRKRHEVRGHWRDDWRNPPGKRCNPHLWETADDNADHIRCSLCNGRQTYIRKHERGDASIGYVTHDYRLKHEVA